MGAPITISIGDLLHYDGKSFRVLHIHSDNIFACEIGTTKTIVLTFSRKLILLEAANTPSMIEKYESKGSVVDIESLTSSQKEKFQRNLEIVQKLEKAYGPDFTAIGMHTPKPELEKVISEYGVHKTTVLRTLNAYLQSGRSQASLVKQQRPKLRKEETSGYTYRRNKKPGRYKGGVCLTEIDFEHFAEATKLYQTRKIHSIQAAYNWMVGVYYAEEAEHDARTGASITTGLSYPSIRQFRNYVNNVLTKEEKDVIQSSTREVRNSKRVLISNSLKDVLGPGDLVEVDACELDIEVVSDTDRNQIIGRPTMYAMIDVFTKMIIAFGIGFNINSVVGMTNMFLNLIEDKVTYCKKMGFTITEEMWPSHILPMRFRVDRGSEAISDKLQVILNRLKISREIVPGGSGSLKGNVEQFFHQVHESQNAALNQHGRITKRFDSKHKTQAVMTLSEYTEILVNYIISHNQKYMPDYPLTKDMVSKQICPIPSDLWKYGCSKYGSPQPILNEDQFLYDLLLSAEKASITRRGIIFKKLKYSVSEDPVLWKKAYEAGTKHVPISMRYDPRLIDHLFYLDSEGKLKTVSLADEPGMIDFSGMTFAEWETLQKAKKVRDVKGATKNQHNRSRTAVLNEALVQQAEEKKSGKNKTNNIREERDKAKQENNRENNIYERTSLERIDIVEPTPNPNTALIHSPESDNLSDSITNSQNRSSKVNITEEELDDLMDELS